MKVTCLTYEFCRKRHPELRLPSWHELTPLDRRRAKRMTVEELRVRRFTILMKREPGVTDRLNRENVRWGGRRWVSDDEKFTPSA